ncbi:VOC family protein [Roseococcus sp. MDT2-1-1]|uniref:VOC family protein n=1 Tax=Sabulicella glaciei TaxID=2984948 RepID=A0ABT3P0B1_9PROT|nr:VOC family protein [Roseococcus sp. MDT2-1-1]
MASRLRGPGRSAPELGGRGSCFLLPSLVRQPRAGGASDPGPGPSHHQRARPRAHGPVPHQDPGDAVCPELCRNRLPSGDGAGLRDGRRRSGRRAACARRPGPAPCPALPGAGGVHHVAFRIPDAAYGQWTERLGVRSSGPVNRFWFRSLYARDPNGILYEVATDGPGFAVDEPVGSLGERLVLPPVLEPRRSVIERDLVPI